MPYKCKIKRNETNRKYYHGRRTARYKANPLLYIYKVAKARAKKFNVPFEIEVTDIIMNEFCPITGEKLELFDNNMSSAMSLDKVDNSKGYIKGNVQVISRKGNRLKGDGTIEQFKNIIKYMESVQCQ